LEFYYGVLGQNRMIWDYQDEKKLDDIFICLDTIHECDGQTTAERQTSADCLYRVNAERRAIQLKYQPWVNYN